MEPPPISQPSSTMSYARERSAPGSSNEPVGAVNGWCSASQRASASFHSNIGKSTTHSGVVAALGHEAEAPRELEPQLPERRRRDLLAVGDEQQQVAGLAAERAA